MGGILLNLWTPSIVYPLARQYFTGAMWLSLTKDDEVLHSGQPPRVMDHARHSVITTSRVLYFMTRLKFQMGRALIKVDSKFLVDISFLLSILSCYKMTGRLLIIIF